MENFHRFLRENPLQNIPGSGFEYLKRGILYFQQALETDRIKFHFPDCSTRWLSKDKSRYHSHTELFFQLNGYNHYHLHGEKITLGPNEILIIPSGVAHNSAIPEQNGEYHSICLMLGHEYAGIHLGGKLNREDREEKIHTRIHLSPYKIFNSYSDVLECMFESAPLRDRNLLRQLLISILASISAMLLIPTEASHLMPVASGGEAFNREKNPLTVQAEKYIQNLIPLEFPDLKTVASAIHCSPNYLNAIFHKDNRITMKVFIDRIRFDFAAKLLKNTTKTVAEIAMECGLNHPSHFIRRFRSAYGVSPTQYRRKNKEI